MDRADEGSDVEASVSGSAGRPEDLRLVPAYPEGHKAGHSFPATLMAPFDTGSSGTGIMPQRELLAALRRELSTPLNSGMNMAGFLLETELTREQRQMIVQLHDSGRRLFRLVTDAVDAVHSVTGETERVLIPFDLRVVTEETATLLRGEALEKGKSIEYRVHHEVPSRLMGNPGHLRQVLWNLGEHFFGRDLAGDIVLRVARLRENSGAVALRFDISFYSAAVRMPIETELAPERHGAAPKTSVADAGAVELRLAIAQCLVGTMGSRVVVEKDPRGAEHAWFDLEFDKQGAVEVGEVSPTWGKRLAGSRMLVVDPTDAIRHSLRAKLEHWGCRVSEASRAEEALQMVERSAATGEPFRFVLVERDQPSMSAHELGVLLQKGMGADAPRMVLFASAGRPGDLDLARSAGFDAYLPKHVDGQDLGESLAEVERLALTGRAGDTRPLVTRHWLAEMRRSRVRVLIIEDDVVSVLVTDWTLRRIGFQVVRVGSVGEVRGMIEEAPLPFDVVILGLRSADPDELSILQEIRAAKAGDRSPAVIVIGYECTVAERDRCQAAGIEAYIARPVDLGNLCEVVETIARIATPGGAETKDPTPDGRGLLAQHQRQGDARGRISVEFAVDAATGQMLIAAAPPAAPGEGEALPALDLARLEATCMNNPGLRAGIVATYLQRSRDALARIEEAVGQGDAAAVEAEVQRLAKMATGLGAVPCTGIYLQMERAVRDGSMAGAGALVVRAYEELSRAEELAAV